MELITWVIPVAGVASILFALYLAWGVLHADTGTEAMQEIAAIIFEGAVAFIRRQYTTIGILAIAGALRHRAGDRCGRGQAGGGHRRLRHRARDPHRRRVPGRGGVLHGLGHHRHVHQRASSNLRTAAAARHSLVGAVQIAMRGGAVSGFLVVALSLLGVWAIFAALRRLRRIRTRPPS